MSKYLYSKKNTDFYKTGILLKSSELISRNGNMFLPGREWRPGHRKYLP